MAKTHLTWVRYEIVYPQVTPPKVNSVPLKNGGWKTILSYWEPVTFQGRTVKLREGIQNVQVAIRTPSPHKNPSNVFFEVKKAVWGFTQFN